MALAENYSSHISRGGDPRTLSAPLLLQRLLHPVTAKFRPTGLGRNIDVVAYGDAQRGLDLLRGCWHFAGRTVKASPATVFHSSAPSPAWREHLIQLGWLKDLAATEQELAQLIARRALGDWFSGLARLRREDVNAASLALARNAGFLMANAANDFHHHLIAAVTTLAKRLSRSSRDAAASLQSSLALASLCLAYQLPTAAAQLAAERIERVVDAVILADGGPADRNPETLVDLLLIMLPLRRQWLAAPVALRRAVERALPMLRMLCHGGQTLGSFQGASARQREIAAILEADETKGAPLNLAPISGYARLNCGPAVVLLDCGKPNRCHAPLALEFSHGNQPIIVNCGHSPHVGADWAEAMQQPAAHSGWDHQAESPCQRGAQFKQSAQGQWLLSHNISKSANNGFSHRRSLFLAADGHELRGEDEISCAQGKAALVLRFHLHSSLTAIEQNRAVVLVDGQGEVWDFTVQGASLTLADSVSLGGRERPCASRQIVISSAAPTALNARWALRRRNRISTVPHFA